MSLVVTLSAAQHIHCRIESMVEALGVEAGCVFTHRLGVVGRIQGDTSLRVLCQTHSPGMGGITEAAACRSMVECEHHIIVLLLVFLKECLGEERA